MLRTFIVVVLPHITIAGMLWPKVCTDSTTKVFVRYIVSTKAAVGVYH